MAHIDRAKKVRRLAPTKLNSAQKAHSPAKGKKNWFHLDLAVLTGLTALISSIAGLTGVIIGLRTLSNEQEKQRSEQIQNIIEWADSNDTIKRGAAIRRAKSLAKVRELELPIALSIFGTVARNCDDEKLRIDVYDALEELRNKSTVDLSNFSKPDQLELLCLEAAMTIDPGLRQVRLRQIEKLSSSDDELKSVAASKLLSLSRDLSEPENVIDMLMLVFSAYSNRGTLEKAIPTLWDALQVRNVLGKFSDRDVVDFLTRIAETNNFIANAQEHGAKEGQSRIGVTGIYLACALVADDQNLKDSFLVRLKQIVASKNQRDFYDAQSLLGGIYRTTKDAKLQSIVKQAADDLDRQQAKSTDR